MWDIRYIDGAVLRDEDTNADGDCLDSGGSRRLYYCQDANFNVTALVDTSGAVVERYAYDAYGQVTFYDGSWGSRASSLFGNELLFCGYRYDPESTLYQVRNRYYHVWLAWTTRDPMGYVDGMSLYGAYFVPDGVDPYGTMSFFEELWEVITRPINDMLDAGDQRRNTLDAMSANSAPTDTGTARDVANQRQAAVEGVADVGDAGAAVLNTAWRASPVSDYIELATGKDSLTGEDLALWEQALAAGGFIPGEKWVASTSKMAKFLNAAERVAKAQCRSKPWISGDSILFSR